MNEPFAVAQALRYAEELRELYATERAQRRRAEDALERLANSYAGTVRALATALELRDDMTGGHAARVTALALRLTEQVAPSLCEEAQLEYGYLLHDLGKIGVPDAILLKNGPLEPEERAVIELHPLHGARILEEIPFLGGLAREIVLAHHERWDGSGYPHGLSGSEIPFAARIFALADAYDAMTNDRPYRAALGARAARAEIEREAGRQFDPELAAAFLAVATEVEAAA